MEREAVAQFSAATSRYEAVPIDPGAAARTWWCARMEKPRMP
ncbi:MAG TPA: hypothetical protein VFD58_01280 [Blastocatellia bacterium]|nr:hypothetical protein [Blastocatellia bacterium]